jgi:hypothetical protein
MPEERKAGLWRQHFHPSVLFCWGVLGWIIGTLLAVAAILLVFDQYTGANVCFIATAAFLLCKITHVVAISNDAFLQRAVFTFVLFGLVGIGITEAVRGVNRWARRRELPAPSQAFDKEIVEQHQVTASSTAQREAQGGTGAVPEAPRAGPSGGIGAIAPSPPRASLPPLQRTAKFAVMIPFNTAPNALPIPMDENPDDPLHRTYQEMQSLASNGTVPEAVRETTEIGQITWNATPVSMDESSRFLARLLQYYIFYSIDALQRNSLTVFLGYPAQARPGIEPPDAEPYPHDKLFHMLADNKFFRPFLYRPSPQDRMWKLKPVMMPRGTLVEFREENQRYLVQLHRPGYFKAEFVVESFAGTGVGDIPKHFVTSQAATTMQWTFFVTMRYSIKHPEDDAFVPDSYARWLDALYDGLQRKMVLAD